MANRRQRTALVEESYALPGFLITVDAFLQSTVVEQPLLHQELGEVPMGRGVQLRLVGIRNHRQSVSWMTRSRKRNCPIE